VTVTAPMGFRASGVTAGLKASGNPDLALVVNDGPSKAAAAVFTSNRVAAAPVHWSRQVVSDGRVDAVILNSGGANACTGPQGFQNTHTTAEKTAEALGLSATDVFVCSTGLIGEQLPMDKIVPGIDAAAAALSTDGGPDAATAIMTTDSVSKQAVFSGADADGNEFTIGGIAKGAGMLAPGLATMLVVLTTDAHVQPEMLDLVLRDATRVTFDRADSDGCMSTNDTVVLMASGASKAVPSAETFGQGLTQVCAELARKLIGDAEGASHDIAIRTFNAATERDAETVSRAVARSNLFKAAIFGKDPNWGPRALRRGHHRRRVRAGPAQRVHERHPDLPKRRHRPGPQAGGPGTAGGARGDRPAGRCGGSHHLDQRPHARLRPREQCVLELDLPTQARSAGNPGEPAE
jgi:glutamate N-acetyltransferase/amino-acid N-acetyltransferase